MPAIRQGTKVQPRTVAVSTTAVLLSSAGNWVERRFYNEGTDPVRLGRSNVTYNATATTDGILLPASTYFIDENSIDAWYAICANTKSTTVSVLEVKG